LNSLLAGIIDTPCSRALDVRMRNAVNVIAGLFLANWLLDPPLFWDHCLSKVFDIPVLDASDWSVRGKTRAAVIELRVFLNDTVRSLLLQGSSTLDLRLMVFYILLRMDPRHADVRAHATLA
jgi:hypothetical protein